MRKLNLESAWGEGGRFLESLIIFSLGHNSHLEIIEGTLGSNAVDQDEALTILHVQISHGCKLFLENFNIHYNGF